MEDDISTPKIVSWSERLPPVSSPRRGEVRGSGMRGQASRYAEASPLIRPFGPPSPRRGEETGSNVAPCPIAFKGRGKFTAEMAYRYSHSRNVILGLDPRIH